MKKKSNVIEIDFKPQNKLTDARVDEILKQTERRLRRICAEKRYEDEPGPECLSDFEILSYINRHPRFYWTEKMQKFEKHIFGCDRCLARKWWLIAGTYPF